MFSIFKKKPGPESTAAFPDGPIVPRLKTTKFVDAIAQLPDATADQLPVAMPVVGDLVLTFAVDIGSSFVTVSQREAKRRNLSNSELYGLALQNIAPILQALQVKPNGAAFQLVTGHDMEACTIMFGSLWADIAKKLDDEVAVIFPHRNLALFAPRKSAEGVAALREAIGQVDFSATHALSRELYVWGPRMWQLMTP